MIGSKRTLYNGREKEKYAYIGFGFGDHKMKGKTIICISMALDARSVNTCGELRKIFNPL